MKTVIGDAHGDQSQARVTVAVTPAQFEVVKFNVIGVVNLLTKGFAKVWAQESNGNWTNRKTRRERRRDEDRQRQHSANGK